MAIQLFSDPVQVLSIGGNPIQVLSIRSDPIRSGPGFVDTLLKLFISRNDRRIICPFYISGEFQIISVNCDLIELDKKTRNRHLNKPMKPTNSQISRWKNNLFRGSALKL